MSDKLLSVREAADYLGLKVSTLYKYKLCGTVPFVKLGSRLLFDPEKLRRWIEQHSYEPTRKSA